MLSKPFHQTGAPNRMRAVFCLIGLATLVASVGYAAEAPLAVRAENVIVPPATGPLTHVVVENRSGSAAFEGVVRLEVPGDWEIQPTEKPVRVEPGAVERVAFTIVRAADKAENSYPVVVTAEGGGAKVVRKQNISCTSAPNFSPKIDGNLEDWENDSIPVTFVTNGKRTVVSTFWNKTHFCVAVEAEEGALTPWKKGEGGAVDALQFALAPRSARTPTADGAKAERYEFVAVAEKGFFGTGGKCFALMQPGDAIDLAREERPLAPLELAEAQVAVRHKKGVTRWECAVPFAAMPRIEPTVGREVRFSLLLHDADGAGVRDLGEALGLTDRPARAWSRWQGAEWGPSDPCDSLVEWGLCTSKH